MQINNTPTQEPIFKLQMSTNLPNLEPCLQISIQHNLFVRQRAQAFSLEDFRLNLRLTGIGMFLQMDIFQITKMGFLIKLTRASRMWLEF